MNGYFTVCCTERSQHHYIDFLLSRYEDLNLKYSFSAALGYLASPLLMAGTAMLCYDEEDQICGAFSYIHGTGEHDYQDRHMIQIQAAYLDKAYRVSRWFVEGLRFLAEHLHDQEEEVTDIQFWAPGDARSQRLFSKFAVPLKVEGAPSGDMEGYRVTVEELFDYLLGTAILRDRQQGFTV
ncbi:hypothetical protein E6C60_2993 [Paenibacillus algicola]|uniref:N-acetyltransferase domain-containing protein n=1 Tax=Paenibacillus algicola TaxID=2565926 RepID=A0A4V1G474_9BACL|nr:hypothetical protein [Paenibacillus algicola]QCT03704.1 hypothetical protein E6C60_2993 [Paenibacillus algicola]